ncbi:MAG: putative lipid II flippase FtsW [Finegoldia sp.]|nr:putative lipid II flippase FtsW [Finegoldia sp.]
MSFFKGLSKEGLRVLYITIFMTLFSVIMVYSSSWPVANSKDLPSYYYCLRQLIFALMGFAVLCFVSRSNYKIFHKYATQIFIISLILTAVTFIPGIGKEINSARRWIGLGIVDFMPSDLLKFGAVNFAAYYISRNYKKNMNLFKLVFHILVILGVPTILVILQPDLSTGIVVGASSFLIFCVSGLPYFITLGFILIGLFVMYVAIYWAKTGYSRIDRIVAFLDPLGNVSDEGWQLVQSLSAVSNGGILGVGFGKSQQKFLYLSQAHNDFIFAIISEEFGFLGAVLLILVYIFFAISGIRIAIRSKSIYSQLLVTGIVFIVILQALINISVVIGLIPPTGITLPFISYGGSSLIIMLGLVGIILNVDKNNNKENL